MRIWSIIDLHGAFMLLCICKKQQVADIVRDVIVDKGCMYVMGEKYLCQYAWGNTMDFGENNNRLIKKVKLKRIFKKIYSVHTCFIVYFL